MGGQHCGEDWAAVDNRTQFYRGTHDQVYAIVEFLGMKGNRTYAVEIRLYDPNTELKTRRTLSFHTPSSWPRTHVHSTWFQLDVSDPDTWPLGRWKAEILVNGQFEVENSFEVTESE